MTKGLNDLDIDSSEEPDTEEDVDGVLHTADSMSNGNTQACELYSGDPIPGEVTDEHQMLEGDAHLLKQNIHNDAAIPINQQSDIGKAKEESGGLNFEERDTNAEDVSTNKQALEGHLPNAVLPLLSYYQCESSESSPRYITFCFLRICS